MEDKIKIVTENNIQIVFADFSGLKTEEIIKNFPIMEELAISNKVNNFILDTTGTFSNDELKKASSASIARVKGQIGEVHVSIIGLSGLQKIIASAIKRDTYFAKDYNDAVNWFVKNGK